MAATNHAGRVDPRVRRFHSPTAVAWQSNPSPEASRLLEPTDGQASAAKPWLHALTFDGAMPPGILLDFGVELHGGVQIINGLTPSHLPVRLRVRFGESYTEAMSEPNQDHSIHDLYVSAPWCGSVEVGSTGFRFVRIDLVDAGSVLLLQGVRAVSLMRPIEPLGTFDCSDERLNQIWQTGARTVHLCMQDYLWDGIKRDRLVWVGDMHPEAAVISAVFGENDVVPASLDFVRDEFSLPAWMNDISSYSLWWIIIHRDWYWHYGRIDYLRQQRVYLLGLLKMVRQHVEKHGRETLTGRRFLDWPTSENAEAIHAGLHALMVMALAAGAELCDALAEPGEAADCRTLVKKMKRHVPLAPGVKQANALLSLAGIVDPIKANVDELSRDPLQGISSFYGYYVLQARALAGDIGGCLDLVRTYWGAMLDRGATTFWEDFDLSWLDNSGHIDRPTPPGQKDLHADFGDYCYVGLRRSLCHGWAAGPTAWLSQHLLGVTPTSPGFATARVRPNLGVLQWVRGSFPTPLGLIRVSAERSANGRVETKVVAPSGVELSNPPVG